MTNAELIAKIKAEIEKLKTFYGELHTDFVCETLLSFLSTLESEKPMNPDDAMKELDEKIALVKQRGTWDGVDVDRYMDEVRGREPENPMDLEEEIKRFVAEYGYERSEDILLIAIVARHFAQWGAEQTLHKVEQWVEKNTCRYIDTQNDEEGYIKEVFLDNAFVDDLKKGMKKIFAKWRAEHFVEK